MQVLFLDFDGVLNSALWKEYAPPSQRADHLDPSAIKLLAQLLVEADLHVVISSAWRVGIPLQDILGALVRQGLPKDLLPRFIGTTPVDDKGRHSQILEWLFNHPEVEYWVSIDDEDFGVPLEHLVLTEYEYGLTTYNVQQAQDLLASQKTKPNVI